VRPSAGIGVRIESCSVSDNLPAFSLYLWKTAGLQHYIVLYLPHHRSIFTGHACLFVPWLAGLSLSHFICLVCCCLASIPHHITSHSIPSANPPCSLIIPCPKQPPREQSIDLTASSGTSLYLHLSDIFRQSASLPSYMSIERQAAEASSDTLFAIQVSCSRSSIIFTHDVEAPSDKLFVGLSLALKHWKDISDRDI
jgi:hypothetical protein